MAITKTDPYDEFNVIFWSKLIDPLPLIGCLKDLPPEYSCEVFCDLLTYQLWDKIFLEFAEHSEVDLYSTGLYDGDECLIGITGWASVKRMKATFLIDLRDFSGSYWYVP